MRSAAIVVGILLAALVAIVALYVTRGRAGQFPIPTPPALANNAYDDFLRVARIIAAIPHKSPSSMTNPPATRAGLLAATAACAKDAAPGLAVLKTALAKQCQHPPQRSAMSLITDDYAQFREIARTINGVEEYYELTGQPSKAVDIMLDGDEFATMFQRGGPLIASMVGGACEAISLTRIEPLLPSLSPAELDQVGARLERIAAKRITYADVLTEEKWTSLAVMSDVYFHPERLPGASGASGQGVATTGARLPLARNAWEAFRFFIADKGDLMRKDARYMDAVIAESRQAFTGKSHVPLPTDMGSIGDLYAIQSRRSFLAREAAFDLLRVEVALLRYNAHNRLFPKSLDRLTPAYLARVPDDPLGGANKPFRYHVTNGGAGFSLYSLGADLTDNGGRIGRYPGDGPGTDIVAGNIWRRRRLPAR